MVDKNEKAKNLLGRLKETPNLSIIVVMETISDEIAEAAKQHNVKILQYSELEVKSYFLIFCPIFFYWNADVLR